MDKHILPCISMVAGTTCPVSFSVKDFNDRTVWGSDLKAYLSLTPYVNESDAPLVDLATVLNGSDGNVTFEIPAEQTKDLRGKYVYQVHLTDGAEHEIYEGYMVIFANRNKSKFS